MTKFKPVRWTLHQACSEFDIHSSTLAKRIKTTGIEPGEDGKFSTKQICAAVFGDLDGEKLGKIKAERELLEITLAKERRILIVAADALRAWEGVMVSARQIIKGSSLSEIEKTETLKNLRSIPLDEIVTKQSDAD